jgi:hypothetical protein
MAGFEKRAKRYPTDLTDEEWLFIQPFLPGVAKRGRRPKTDFREVLDALRYLARAQAGAGACCRTILRLGRQCIGGSGGSFVDCCSARSMTLR